MHTRDQLHLSQFTVDLGGGPVEDFLEWDCRDRLGIVVDRPLGGLGASLAMQLATAEFYAHESRAARPLPLYADNYLFHVGGRWGDFSAFDFWPRRREVFLAADPAIVLEAINDRGITHLLVPDREPRECEFGFYEKEAAIDRLKLCLIYSPDGDVADGDVTIATRDPVAIENAAAAALGMESLLDYQPDPALMATEPFRNNFAHWIATASDRLDELTTEQKSVAATRIREGLVTSRLKERYRRCATEQALARLP
jgi:hypothetical protein